MSSFESSPVALVPTSTSYHHSSRLRKLRPVTPLVLPSYSSFEDHIPLEVVPINDYDDGEGDDEDHESISSRNLLNVSIHFDALSSLRKRVQRTKKNFNLASTISIHEPYIASAIIFALFFILVITVTLFGSNTNGPMGPSSKPIRPSQVAALRHATVLHPQVPPAVAATVAPAQLVSAWIAAHTDPKVNEDMYRTRAARADVQASSPSPATAPARREPATDAQGNFVYPPSGIASAKFRVPSPGSKGNNIKKDEHGHPEDLEQLFRPVRRRR